MPNLTPQMLASQLQTRRQLLAKYEQGIDRIKSAYGPKSDYTRQQIQDMGKRYNPALLREQINVLEYLLKEPN